MSKVSKDDYYEGQNLLHSWHILPAHYWIFVYNWLFWASKASYRNVKHIKSPLLKVICLLLGWFVISDQAAQKINSQTAQNKRISNEQYVILVTCLIVFQGTLLNTLREARPTIFLGVPRVWEKLMEGMQERGKHVKGLKRKIAEACKKAGRDLTNILHPELRCMRPFKIIFVCRFRQLSIVTFSHTIMR